MIHLGMLFLMPVINCYNKIETKLDYTVLSEELRKYPLSKENTNQYVFCTFIMSDTRISREIYNYFINRRFCPLTVVDTKFESRNYIEKSTEMYVFVNEMKRINEIIDQIQNYSFWSISTHNHFIICTPLNNTDFLGNLLVTIWRKNVVNFIVAFVYKVLQIVTYNPFKNEIIYLTEQDEDFFPDKIKNLYGYKLKVSVWEEWPLMKKKKNEWIGTDFRLLSNIIHMINATVDIIEPPYDQHFEGVYQNILNKKSDFSINTYLQTNNSFVQYSYPHIRYDYVVLIPFKQNSITSKSLSTIFHPDIWILYGTTSLIVSLFLTISDTGKSFLKLFFYIIGTLFANLYLSLDSKALSQKIVLLVFILASMVLQTAFQGFIIKSFMTPYSYGKIKTLSDLKKSGIKIRIYPSILRVIHKDGIQNQFIPSTIIEMTKQHRKKDTTTAYLVNTVKAHQLVSMWESSREGSLFYILDEVLLPGNGAYIFQKNSPYVGKINQCIAVLKQFGLEKATEMYKPAIKQEGNVVLNLEHFREVLILLISGLISGSVVFAAELLIFNIKKFKF